MRHLINRIDVARFDNRAFTHITKQANLALFTIGNGPSHRLHQNIGLDADPAQFPTECWVGLVFISPRREYGKRGQMHKRFGRAANHLQLTNSLKKRQSFNIAHRAANLAQHEIQTRHRAG